MVLPRADVGFAGGTSLTTARFPDLEDATVFITGGGSGIGAALTAGFAAQGARVAFVGRSDYSAFAAELGQSARNAPLFIQCDVTNTTALQAAMLQAVDHFGPLKVLVNNAANDLRMEALGVTEDDWQEMIDVNLKHYFFACQQAAQLMSDGGAIINFSSISYMFGAAGMAPYVTSNAGITGMTRALAREWGDKGIRVNALAPGWVLTEKQLDKWATPEGLEKYQAEQCIPQMMKPDDIVGPTLFLASDASAMMTSQVLVVDAGRVVTG